MKVNIKIGRFKKLVILVNLVSFETGKICEKCCKNFLPCFLRDLLKLGSLPLTQVYTTSIGCGFGRVFGGLGPDLAGLEAVDPPM